MPNSPAEKPHLERVRRHPEQVIMPLEVSAQEQFEYLRGPEFEVWLEQHGERKRHVLLSNGLAGFTRLIAAFARNIPGVLRQQARNFRDVEPYLDHLERSGQLPRTAARVIDAYPNQDLWLELKAFAWQQHGLVVGFTELPRQHIFTGKAVLFRHALVFAQEMAQEPIERAPQVDAGVEVMRVYNRLGLAVNDIARWLREREIVCMANHPLGGLVDTTPLAEKAGLGAIGHSGLLITPEFGPRCRIAPIFVDARLFAFTDSDQHAWLHDYCATCHSCQKGCPMDAILAEKRVTARHPDGVRDREQTIDRERCFLYFARTMGCALCIKNCPFSKHPERYARHREQTLRRAAGPAPTAEEQARTAP